MVDGPAILREWEPPVYPAEALKSRQSGMVNVMLIVDDTGQVTSARALEDSDEAFVASAIAAVKSWVFAPELEDGKAVACCLETLVTFSPATGQQQKTKGRYPSLEQTFRRAQRTMPRPTVTPPGNYPEVLVERKFGGVAKFSGVVTPAGRLVQPRIVAASHVDFVQAALDSLKEWEFAPGMQGDLTVEAPVEGQISFDSLVAKVGDVYEANGISAPDGSLPTVKPEPLVIVDPVLPLDILLEGQGGSASVAFTVNESGTVLDVSVKEATHPAFGEALVAAVESWSFARPIQNNQVVSVALLKRAEFAAIPEDPVQISDPNIRLVLAMRQGEIGGARGLDEKITPTYQVRPEYPRALKAQGGPAGRADIEFIIDRFGRVRLPLVVSATHAEFGWSAATAVSQWVFRTPRRGGKPVDVKVKIPITFGALEN